jgi:hypothetical protein
MTGNHVIDVLFALQGMILAIMTFVGLVAPKGSKVGVIAAKIGTDIKGQTVAHDPEALKKLLEEAWEQSKDMPPSQIAYGILHYLGGAAKMTPEEIVTYAEKMGVEEGLRQ